MSNERFKLPSAVFLVMRRGDDILLMRRANTGWHDGGYDLPAGHVDGGEASSTATIREGNEELGITINPEDLTLSVLVHGLFEDGKEYYNLFFTVEKWEGMPAIMEPDKCDDLQWFPLNNLPDHLTPNSQLGITALRDGQSYVEYGFKK